MAVCPFASMMGVTIAGFLMLGPTTTSLCEALLGTCVPDRNFKRFNLSEFSHPSKFNRARMRRFEICAVRR